MKKIFVILIICLFIIGNTVYAVKFGVKSGISMYKMTSFNGEGMQPFTQYNSHFLTGYRISLFSELSFFKKLYFQTELNLSNKGVNLTIDDSSGFGVHHSELNIKQNYFELAGLIKYYFGEMGSLSTYILAGPYIAYNLSNSANATKITPAYVYGEKIIESVTLGTDLLKTEDFDVGIILGLGTQIKAGSGYFLIEANYSIGFVDVLHFDNLSKEKNTVFSFLIGYKF